VRLYAPARPSLAQLSSLESVKARAAECAVVQAVDMWVGSRVRSVVEVYTADEPTELLLQSAVKQPDEGSTVFNASFFSRPLRLGIGSSATSVEYISAGSLTQGQTPVKRFTAMTDRGPNIECVNPHSSRDVQRTEPGMLPCPFALPQNVQTARVFLQPECAPALCMNRMLCCAEAVL
jgi:hypothetical protein